MSLAVETICNTYLFYSRRAFRSQLTSAPAPAAALLSLLVWVPGATSDFDDDAVQCFSEATGMIFIYVVVWQVRFIEDDA